MCHNEERGPFGRETLDIFAEEGVNPERVLIGHACGVGDRRYSLDVLKRGAGLGFDRVRAELLVNDRMRVASLCGLITIGEDRSMLSHDYASGVLGRLPPGLVGGIPAQCPSSSYSHILKNILPQLRQAGVREMTIRTLMVDNPRAYFT